MWNHLHPTWQQLNLPVTSRPAPLSRLHPLIQAQVPPHTRMHCEAVATPTWEHLHSLSDISVFIGLTSAPGHLCTVTTQAAQLPLSTSATPAPTNIRTMHKSSKSYTQLAAPPPSEPRPGWLHSFPIHLRNTSTHQHPHGCNRTHLPESPPSG
jgi:hypothetical protein